MIPLIIGSFCTALYNISIVNMNKYGDSGHPCFTPRSILKKIGHKSIIYNTAFGIIIKQFNPVYK